MQTAQALPFHSCASPLLGGWADLLSQLYNAACAALHMDGICEVPLAKAALCSTARLLGWPAAPATLLLASLLAAILVAALLLALAAQRLHAMYAQAAGQAVVTVATKTLQELRREDPGAHPGEPHYWFAAPAAEVTAPLLCAACHRGIKSPAPGASMQCCACCGTVAHDGRCAGKLGRTCRPLCLPGREGSDGVDGAAALAGVLPHFWQAVGTVRDDEPPLPSAPAAAGAGDPGASPCLYCREPVDPDMFAAEPLWRCAQARGGARLRRADGRAGLHGTAWRCRPARRPAPHPAIRTNSPAAAVRRSLPRGLLR